MKKFVILLLLCCLRVSAVAGDYRNLLVVWQKDGSKAYFELDENPKTTFSGVDMVISTTDLIVSYPLSEIMRYTYENTAAGIDDLKVNTPYVYLRNKNELVAYNVPIGTTISVYAADGKMCISQDATGDSQMTLSLHQLPSGVYLVKFGNITYKIMKR